MEIPEEAQIQPPAKKVDFRDNSIIVSCMDLSKPDGEGEVTITSITIRHSETTLNFEGPIEGYGTVFVTQTWKSIDSEKTRGVMDGQARVLLNDGTLLYSPVVGTFRREGGIVKLFFTDAVSNGDQNFVAWDIDISSKKAKVRYYSLK